MPPSRVSPPPPPGAAPIKTPQPNGLTTEELEFWDKNGYLILPDALTPTQVSDLLSETSSLLHNFPLSTHPMTKFSTGETSEHVGDDYFLTSGNSIRFFFEEGAFDPSTGELSKPKHLSINKIGHGLHTQSPAFKDATLTSRHAQIARDLGLRDPRVLQSMVICKQPEIGARVPPHQDSVFLYTDPPSAIGFWFALEDCTRSNGCLAFAPGSHKRAGVGKRFVRGDQGGTTFIDNEGGRWPDGQGQAGRDEKELKEGDVPDEEYVLGECKAGSLVLIHGNLLHKSESNTSDKGRMIYTFHCIEGENVYDGRNWLQPEKDGFSKLNDALKR